MGNNRKKMDEKYVYKWWKSGQFLGPTMNTMDFSIDVFRFKQFLLFCFKNTMF